MHVYWEQGQYSPHFWHLAQANEQLTLRRLLTWARQGANHVPGINSYDSPSTFWKWELLSPLTERVNWGTESLCPSPCRQSEGAQVVGLPGAHAQLPSLTGPWFCSDPFLVKGDSERGSAGIPSPRGSGPQFRPTPQELVQADSATGTGSQRRGAPWSTEGAAAVPSPPYRPEGLNALGYLYSLSTL